MKYDIRIFDTKNPEKNKEFTLFVDCDTIEEAKEEADAQLNLACSEGGFPYDEKWEEAHCQLMAHESTEILWEDYLTL